MRGCLKLFAACLTVVCSSSIFAASAYRTSFPLPAVGKSFSGAAVTLRTWQASEPEFQKIAAAGFRYIRMNIWWKNIEPVKGKYAFGSFDTYLAWAQKYGLRLNLIFDTDNPFYGKATAQIVQPFTNYTVACTKHFAGTGILWEMINEPDISGLPVADYMTLEHSAAQAIRSATPDEWLLGPSVSSISIQSVKDYFKACLDAGILNDVDAVTVHPYIHDTPETIAVPFSATRALINSYLGGSAKPLFASEWGYPSFDLPIVLTPKPYTPVLPNLLLDSNAFVSNISWKGWYTKPTATGGVPDPFGGAGATKMDSADWSASTTLGYSGIGQLGALVKGDYYVASVWLRSEGGTQNFTMGLNDHDKITFIIDRTWRRYSFSFVDTDPWNQGRMLQITENGMHNAAWDIYCAQLEHIGQLTPAVIDKAQRSLQGAFMVRAYRACLANKVPYMAMFEWIETTASPGCGMNHADGTPYPAYSSWKHYYDTTVTPPPAQ